MTDHKLSDPALLCTKAYINGKLTEAEDGSTFNVDNTSNGELIAEVAYCGDT